jgi:hypothetical protein
MTFYNLGSGGLKLHTSDFNGKKINFIISINSNMIE